MTEHIASYPHGTDRVVCPCGFDSGVVPGAFACPDYDREWTDGPVAAVWRRHIADVTFEALTALGWQYDAGEPMAGRDFDPSPSGHWTGCLCKWCTLHESCARCGHHRQVHGNAGCSECPSAGFAADHLFDERA